MNEVKNRQDNDSPSRNGGAIRISAPATVANLVCGFDILGMALNHPQDIMEISLLDDPVVQIKHTDGYDLPVEPAKNVAGASLLALQEACERKIGFEVSIDKCIKPGSGLGSSAASSAGAVVGANYLLGNIFSNEDLVRFAMNGEKVASGGGVARKIPWQVRQIRQESK